MRFVTMKKWNLVKLLLVINWIEGSITINNIWITISDLRQWNSTEFRKHQVTQNIFRYFYKKWIDFSKVFRHNIGILHVCVVDVSIIAAILAGSCISANRKKASAWFECCERFATTKNRTNTLKKLYQGRWRFITSNDSNIFKRIIFKFYAY